MFLWTSTLKSMDKKFTAGECTSLQDQILHTATYRNARLPLVLTRLSGEEGQRIELLYSKTFLIKESKERRR